MARKAKGKSPVEEPIEEKVDTSKEVKEEEEVFYKEASLYLKCGVCGEETMLAEKIEGGVSIVLPTKKGIVMNLACPKCKASMALLYKEIKKNPTPPKIEVVSGFGEARREEDAKDTGASVVLSEQDDYSPAE